MAIQDPTEFAEAMVEKLQAVLLANAGLKFVEIDGTRTAYTDLEAQYQHWQTQLAKAKGEKPRVVAIDMSGGSR